MNNSMKNLFLAVCQGVLAAACGGGGGGDAHPADAAAEAADLPWIKADTSTPGSDSGNGNHAPMLSKIGDRVVAVGETLEIEAKGTDADQDELTYSVYGDIPGGAKFDKTTHVFTWVPLQADTTVYLTFAVSDGQDMDRETVQIKVVSEKVGHPPVFEEISDQQIEVGIPFSLQLEASDPDGDSLEFGIMGVKPPVSEVNVVTGLFTWTPPADLDGSMIEVTFVVSDGVFKDKSDVRFLVGEVAGGSPPEFEKPGLKEAEVGKQLVFVVKASDPDGQAVTLGVESGLPAGAVFDSTTGTFEWTPGASDEGHTVEVKFSASDGMFTTFLIVKIHVLPGDKPPSCVDDQFEPNNVAEQAKSLSPGNYSLSICDTEMSPVDSDWFFLSLGAGQEVSVRLEFEHDLGDIDMALAKNENDLPVAAASDGTTDVEEFSYVSETGGEFLLLVYGVGTNKYSNPYDLELTVSESQQCNDDPLEPDDSTGEATLIQELEKTFTDMVLCPDDDDFFEVPLEKGDMLLAAASPKTGALEMDLRDGDGKSIDHAGPGSGPLTVGADDVDVTGSYFVHVHSGSEASYSFEILVDKAPPEGCSPKSCPTGDVCDPDTGECVFDFCSGSGDCPANMPCIQTYCVDDCGSHDDCRPEYLCKAFPQGKFCGVSGDKQSGEECLYFSQCADERVCLFDDMGGYCAVYGCSEDWDCPLDAWCVEESGLGDVFNYCAAECDQGACPGSSNFSCQPGDTMNGFEIDLCLPDWIEI